MKIVILALFAFWWYALMRAFVARGGDAFGEWPISNQITGKLSEPFDAAFLGLGAALMLCPFAFGVLAPWVLGISAFAAAGCIGTMLTRRVWPNERAHITLAGIAFAGASASFAAISWQLHAWAMFWLAVGTAIPAVIQAILNFKPIHLWIAKFSRTEWAYAILITAWAVVAVFTLK